MRKRGMLLLCWLAPGLWGLAQGEPAHREVAQEGRVQGGLAQRELAQEGRVQGGLARQELAQERPVRRELAQDEWAGREMVQGGLAQRGSAQEGRVREGLARQELAQERPVRRELAQGEWAGREMVQGGLAQRGSGPEGRVQGDLPRQELARERPFRRELAQGELARGRRGQERLTLEECYRLGEANYPLTRQRALIEKTRDYTLANIAKGVYPQVAVNGTATYQSDVTKITIPPIAGMNINIPTVPKDQYKLYGEVSQTLTDFGINRQRRAVSRTDAELQEANLTTDLYSLKDRINQLFFGALLIDGQLEQNELAVQDIQTGIKKVSAAVRNGTDFNSSLNKLRAELLNTEQHSVELRASRSAYTDMLGLFINRVIDTSTVLERPQEPTLGDSIRRPELAAYDLQSRSYAQRLELTRRNLYPSLSAFFQGGLGEPNPVNFLSTSLSGYYLTGLRLTWTIGNNYTYKKDRLISRNNQEMVQNQRNTFLFNTQLSMRQENAEIKKYRELIKSDDEIVQLRESVDKSSAAQLENGVINANDYLQDVNAAAQARQVRVVHAMQLLIAQYNYKTTAGL